MIARRRHSWIGTAFRTGNHGLLLAIAGAATGFLTAAAPAHADITYTFSGATATFQAGTDDITGSFTFAPPAPPSNAPFESNVMITLTGPQSPGTYTEVGPTDNIGNDSIRAPIPGAGIGIVFADPLTDAPDAIAEVQIIPASGPIITAMGTDVAGEAVPVAVPAPLIGAATPANVALLGAALGLFLFMPRSTRRDHLAHQE